MFDITFEDPEKKGDKLHVWQNSWGITTRTIGVMIMAHGDNQGLVLPPRVACTQVVIVPTGLGGKLSPEDHAKLFDSCKDFERQLKKAGVRAVADLRDNYSPPWKYNHWELKGVPIRLEVGPRDLAKGVAVAAQRATGRKVDVALAELTTLIPAMLEEIHHFLFNKALQDRNDHMKTITKWEEFLPALDGKNIVLAPFCEEVACEERIKKETTREDAMGAKSLCIPFAQTAFEGETKCIHPECGKVATRRTLFGRSY